MPEDSAGRKDGVAASELETVLSRVLQSRSFRNSKQLQRLLRFILTETLEGRGERIKEYVLGVEVFGRPSSFDPRFDSLVRVDRL